MSRKISYGCVFVWVACSSSSAPVPEPTLEAPIRREAPTGKVCTEPFADAGKLRFDPDGWETDFCKHSVPYAELRGGGPPRDGIPPIDDPVFVTVAEADKWIGDREPIIAYSHGGVARAYPLQIMTWHEVVNDVVGGDHVAVTFCPLCYAAIVFERPLHEGVRLTFGTSGNLRNSDLVMWDRQTESWWQQFEGKAIVGSMTGAELVQRGATIVSWRDFKESHPSGEVLSRETGFDRAYGKNPYVGYDDIDKKPFLFEGSVDSKRPPMAHVVGVIIGDDKRAFGLDDLEKQKAVNESVGGVPIIIFWKAGGASALDESSIADSKDIGVTAVFDRRVNGRTLTFQRRKDGAFEDLETKTTWTILGKGKAGPLAGTQLEPLPHHNVFWFVWSAFVL